jgi:hypothetical protein
MSASLFAPGAGASLFATVSMAPAGEAQVAWPFGRRSSAGCTLRTQHTTIGDAGAHAVFLSCPTSRWGAAHGVNEHGVAIAARRAAGGSTRAPSRSGLTGTDLVRLGLERAGTAYDAVDVVSELIATCGLDGDDQLAGDAQHEQTFLAVDPRGAALLETAGSDRGPRQFPAGAIVADGAPPEPFPAAEHTAMNRNAAVRRLREVSAATGRGPWVCAASMVADLPCGIEEGEPMRVYVAPGSPEVSIFVPAFPRTANGPPPSIPLELSGEELWLAADRLRALVGQRPEALAEVRAALDPLEEELWAEADDVAGHPARWAAAGAAWGGQALRALRGCIPSSD